MISIVSNIQFKKRLFFQAAFFIILLIYSINGFAVSTNDSTQEVSTVEKLHLQTSGTHRAFVVGNVGMNISLIPLAGTDLVIDSFRGFVWGVDFGYQFVPYMAFEIGFLQYKRTGTRLTADVADAMLKGIWPTGHHLKLFGKAGITYLFPENVYGKRIVPSMGLGFEVVVNTYSSVIIQVTGITLSGKIHFGAAMVGLALYFGEEESLQKELEQSDM